MGTVAGDQVGEGLDRQSFTLTETGSLAGTEAGKSQNSKGFVCFSLNPDIGKTCTVKVERDGRC